MMKPLLICAALMFLSTGTYAEVADANGPEKARELSPWEAGLVAEIIKMDPDNFTPLKYRKFRSNCIELSTCNRARFESMLKNMLLETPMLKDNPKLIPLLDRSQEYNLALLFAMVATHNRIPLDEIELLDLKARSMGVSSFAKNKEQASLLVQVYLAIEAENRKLK